MDLKDAQEKTTVLQSKLYQAAKATPTRRFHQLYDKLFREDVLLSAYAHVKVNGGAPGVDGVRIADIENSGVAAYLATLGAKLREQTYRPQPLRRVEIPKANGKMRRLGIPTVEDRTVQAAMKLILEPIFEADFASVSFGFRPGIGQDSGEGFDFLGFHHRRGTSTYGRSKGQTYLTRWASTRSRQRFRDRIKELLDRAGYIHNAAEWRLVRNELNRYIRGWGQYYREGQRGRVMAKLDGYVNERVARYLARSQPKGKKRRRRHWLHFSRWLRERQSILLLSSPRDWGTNPYRGQANTRWKAV